MGNGFTDCRICNHSLPKTYNIKKNERVLLCFPIPETEVLLFFSKKLNKIHFFSKENLWFVYMNKQCRVLSNSQCIWSSEILKKLKNLKNKFNRESNLSHILNINKNFLSILTFLKKIKNKG